MDNFLNNGQTFFKLIVGVRKYHILIHIQKKCWFENWLFKYFFLEIYRSEADYIHAYESHENLHSINNNAFTVKSYYCEKKYSFLGYKQNGEKNVLFDEMISALYQTNTLSWIFIVLVDCENSPQVEISLDSTLYTDPETTSRSLLLLLNISYLAEKQQIPILYCGLSQPGLDPTIYHTCSEHVNYYTTDAVVKHYLKIKKYFH